MAASTSSSNPSSSSNSSSPCGACKFLRRKCVPSECIFAPYFPSDEPLKFANAHKIFGASNMAKILSDLHPSQRADAVSSLSYEAEARIKDPVYGCVGAISYLKRHIQYLEQELRVARTELARYMGAISHGGGGHVVLRQAPQAAAAAAAISQMNLPFAGQAMAADVVHPFLLSESFLSSSSSSSAINVSAAPHDLTTIVKNNMNDPNGPPNNTILAVVSSSASSPPRHRAPHHFVDHNFWLLSNSSAPAATAVQLENHDNQNTDVPPTIIGHGHAPSMATTYVDAAAEFGMANNNNNMEVNMQLARAGAQFYSNYNNNYRANPPPPHHRQLRLLDVRSTSSCCGGDGGASSNIVSTLSSSDPITRH